MRIRENLERIRKTLPEEVTLVAVSKTFPASAVEEALAAGQLDFGENRVQEMTEKQPVLPDVIRWHQIGHLQTNKVKYIAPFIHLIHAADSLKLLSEIQKQGAKNNRVIDVLLQIHIAEEEQKFGFSYGEAEELFAQDPFTTLKNIRVRGLMGMATFTEDQEKVGKEFRGLRRFFEQAGAGREGFDILSMGMSGDYRIAVEEGSTMVRIGSAIFGNR